jgi:hypothetical protein
MTLPDPCPHDKVGGRVVQHASASKTMNASGSEMERVLVLMALIPWSVHEGGQWWSRTAWQGRALPGSPASCAFGLVLDGSDRDD